MIRLNPPISGASGLLTVREVAGKLRCSTMTVYRLVNAKSLPAVRIGRSYRIREDDVNRYLADHYTKAG